MNDERPHNFLDDGMATMADSEIRRFIAYLDSPTAYRELLPPSDLRRETQTAVRKYLRQGAPGLGLMPFLLFIGAIGLVLAAVLIYIE